MKLRLIIPAALTAVALAGCGNSASESAGADASASDSASPSVEASEVTSEPAPEATAGENAGEPEATPAATTPMPTTGQGEQPSGAGVASFAECSEDYLALTTDLLPGGAVTPELLEKWQLSYDDASQYYAEGSASDAARVCAEVLSDVKATVGG